MGKRKERIYSNRGDFNVRIGEERGKSEEGYELRGRSKDKITNGKGRNLVELVEELGECILNGMTKGDKEGEFTYVGARGISVIDYIIVNENCIDLVKMFKVGVRIDSDHMPICLELHGRRRWEEKKKTGKEEKRLRIYWDEESKKIFKESTDDIEWVEGEEGGGIIKEKWIKLKEIIHGALVKEEVTIRKREIGHEDWWDRSCTKKKREVHKAYKKWRNGRSKREEYLEERKKLKEFLEIKQKSRKEEEERELRNMKNETEVWKFINKKRGVKKWKENNISKEKWKDYFTELLEGKEVGSKEDKKQEQGSERKEEERINKEEEEEDIKEEEIEKIVRKMKKKKAAGIDGIPMLAWKYGGRTIRKGLLDILRVIWKSGRIPEEWKTSVIVPLFKKGDQEKMENYRGISLLCTAYKIYAELLRQRLEEEIERKELLPESQRGFRKGRGVLDNVFLLSHMVQREKKDKVYALFVDLRAAFDKVVREKLWEVLEEKGINEKIIRRVKMIYEDERWWYERTKEGMTNSFTI